MKIYMNDMQLECMNIAANTSVIVGGRGVGKGELHACYILRNMQAMPRSTGGIIVPNLKRGLSNTLPSMLEHLERWGYRRNVHWIIGKQPPKNLNWPMPLIPPEQYENVISFYNGSIGFLVSQDRAGTSNSKSFDWLDIDEAKFIDYNQLKDETFPANRGQVKDFGECPWHHGMLITSDMPLTKTGSWFLNFEKNMDIEQIDLIKGLIKKLYTLKNSTRNSRHINREISDIREALTRLRKTAIFYKEYSSLVNLQILGMSYIRQMKRDLPPLTFQTSIMCKRVGIQLDGFYSNLRPQHIYTSSNHTYLDSVGYNFSILKIPDSRMDGDLLPQSLCISFDFNANINWMCVGQPDRHRKRLNVVKSFYVKYERKLEALCEDFDAYYKYFSPRQVIFYYDHTALGSNYAVNEEDFQWVITRKLTSLGWTVLPVYIGKAMNHMEKHLLINRAFAGKTELTPYINRENNQDLLISMQSAGIYNGKKDKRGEKLAETEEDKLESRTDGSDAFDTLYIGCAKFPQSEFLIRATSGSS